MTDPNGLYQMRARYYNPEIKRFMNRDAMIGSIQAGQTLNRYAYVNGNPVLRFLLSKLKTMVISNKSA